MAELGGEAVKTQIIVSARPESRELMTAKKAEVSTSDYALRVQQQMAQQAQQSAADWKRYEAVEHAITNYRKEGDREKAEELEDFYSENHELKNRNFHNAQAARHNAEETQREAERASRAEQAARLNEEEANRATEKARLNEERARHAEDELDRRNRNPSAFEETWLAELEVCTPADFARFFGGNENAVTITRALGKWWNLRHKARHEGRWKLDPKQAELFFNWYDRPRHKKRHPKRPK